MKKLLVVVGTRPNFIKVTRMRAVAAARGDWQVKLVHTGQHFDDRMSTVFFEQFGLVPDHWLGIAPGTPNTQMAHIMLGLERVAQEVGYVGGFVLDGGWIPAVGARRFGLPRLNIAAGLSTRGFRLRLADFFAR